MVLKSKEVEVLVLVVILSVFIAGCQGGGNDLQTETPFAGGTMGLSARFLPDAPPDFIYDNGKMDFGVSMEIVNLGEDDIEPGNGYVEILGISPRDFGLSSQSDLRQDMPFYMRGARKSFGTVIEGDTNVLSFDGLNYLTDVQGNYLGFLVRANMCYNYKTRVSSQLCLKRDLMTNIQTKEICDVTGSKITFNSGAPIQIIDLNQYPVGDNKVGIRFTIAHVGAFEDRFYKINTDCDDKVTNLYKDMVYVRMVSNIDGKRPSCVGLMDANADSSEGYVKLYNGAPKILSCTVDASGIDYVAQVPLNIELEYRYSQFIEKNIIVQDISTSDFA